MIYDILALGRSIHDAALAKLCQHFVWQVGEVTGVMSLCTGTTFNECACVSWKTSKLVQDLETQKVRRRLFRRREGKGAGLGGAGGTPSGLENC